MVDGGIQQRKADHLRIVAEEDVAHRGGTLLDCVRLVHNALPELALDDVDIQCEFFDKQLKAPLMITSMTGGGGKSGELNHHLAAAAGKAGIAFAVGSQRALLEHPERLDDFTVRPEIGDGVLLGNIGAQQLREYKPQQIAELVEMIDADGICVHLNPAHELAQDEGERNFHGLLDAIGEMASHLEGRVLVKETGAGLSGGTVHSLIMRNIAYIDVAGAGGTSWTKVENYRANGQMSRAVSVTFGEWGIPTAAAIIVARRNSGYNTCIIGSGGISSGLDAARAIACGAAVAGLARAVLLAYLENEVSGVETFLSNVIHELKTAMLLTGSRDLAALHHAQRVYTGALKDWIDSPMK